MKTFNRNRFHILVQNYLKSENKTVLDIKSVNKLEPVLQNCSRYFSDIKLGCSLAHFTSEEIQLGAEQFTKEQFLIKSKGKTCWVALGKKSEDKSLLEALFKIEVVEFLTCRSNAPVKTEESERLTKLLFNEFMDKVVATGWSLAYTQFSPGLFRYSIVENYYDKKSN